MAAIEIHAERLGVSCAFISVYNVAKCPRNLISLFVSSRECLRP